MCVILVRHMFYAVLESFSLGEFLTSSGNTLPSLWQAMQEEADSGPRLASHCFPSVLLICKGEEKQPLLWSGACCVQLVVQGCSRLLGTLFRKGCMCLVPTD